jgi:carboxymethylenebutenolidase
MKLILSFFALILLVGTVHAQDFALKQLEDSPRHHEWVVVKSGDKNVHAFVAYPEVSEKALVAIVIHENRGLTDWVRSFADQLAAAGYIAIAPDLLSDFSETAKRTSDFATSDDARNALYELDQDQITLDLTAVQAYGKSLEAGNGKTVVMGFCWGGAQTFRFATNNGEMEASFVFYGNAPSEDSQFAAISKPVHGFYAENDARINAELERVETTMKSLGKTFQYEIYAGSGHAYMRSGDDPSGSEANVAARNDSWTRLLSLLKSL